MGISHEERPIGEMGENEDGGEIPSTGARMVLKVFSLFFLPPQLSLTGVGHTKALSNSRNGNSRQRWSEVGRFTTTIMKKYCSRRLTAVSPL